MTIDAIKNEITKRLREVRSDSLEFADSEHFPELRSLTADALGDVSTCMTVDDIEAINGILERIEDCWNRCRSDVTGEESNDVLFEFDFELDDDGSDDDDGEDEAEDVPPAPKFDISSDMAKLDELFDKYEGTGSRTNDRRLKKIYKSSVSELRKADDRVSLSNARNRYRSRFGKLDKSIRRYNETVAAKPDFDELHPPKSIKKPNIARVIFGCIAFLTAAVYGIITAISEKHAFYLWDGWVYGIAAAGLLYLLLAAVYGIASKSSNYAAVRRLTFARLIIVPFALGGAVALWLLLPSQLGLLGAFIATLPLTLSSLGMYLVYRLRLLAVIKKHRKQNKKKRKK